MKGLKMKKVENKSKVSKVAIVAGMALMPVLTFAADNQAAIQLLHYWLLQLELGLLFNLFFVV